MGVWRSWLAREDTAFALPRERFDDEWKRLEEIDSQHDVHYVPLDTKQRDKAHSELEKKLGRELVTDFKAKNKYDKDVPLVERDLSWIYDIKPVKENYALYSAANLSLAS